MVDQVYRPRRPKASPLWQCLQEHFDRFLDTYEERYQDCGDLERGFARVRCDDCKHEYLDFHPHLHALVADGLFARSGLFYCLPNVSLKPLEEMFRARVITFLVDKGLLPVARANMLRGWVHSGFNVHRSRRVLPDEREDLERLAQYIIRNPFAVEKMQVTEPNRANPDGSIIYHSGMNPKIQLQLPFALLTPARSCRPSPFGRLEVFSPCDFIAAITQHIPDKSFQLVRYYGWYSNKMRGQRDKHAAEEAEAAGQAVQIIDVSEHKPRRIPSAKWRELINPPSRKATADLREGLSIRCLVRRSFSVGGCVRSARKRCASFLSSTSAT